MQIKRMVSICLQLFILSALGVGCSSNKPETIIVKQTVISEVPVTVVVTRKADITPESMASITRVIVPISETFSLPSDAGDRDYEIYVSLPQGYFSGRRSYPVIYLLDGDLTFRWATEYSRWLSSNSIIPETIIVGINNSQRRDHDLLPKDTEGVENREGVENFLTFIKEEFIPFIDDNYRTEPTDRTLAGISHSGTFALYALFNSSETFNRYIVTTPALSKNDLIFEYEEEYAGNHSDLPVKLFLSVGDLEDTTNVEELFNRLKARNYSGLEMNMVIVEDSGHMTTIIQGFIDGLPVVFSR